MTAEEEKKAEKFYQDSPVTEYQDPRLGWVEIDKTDLFKLMHDYAQSYMDSEIRDRLGQPKYPNTHTP